MSEQVLYRAFLGTWVLDPSSCDYEQGDPPQAATYSIEESDGVLVFTMTWVDGEEERHEVTFSGPPNGEHVAFAGGELADSLAVHAVSERELNSSAYWQGKELMVAQRQLDESGQAMRVVQLVRLPDGSRPTNVSVYKRRLPS